MKKLNHNQLLNTAKGLLLLLLVTFSNNAFSHLTELAYCFDCNGNVTIYVDQWHGTQGPLGTNDLDLKITVNGTTTTYTNMQPNGTNATNAGTTNTGIIASTLANLPDCQGSRTLVGDCQQNNTWDVYYFPAMPRGVPITIQITGSENLENSAACNAVDNIATFYIPIAPIASKSGNFCVNQSTKLSVHTTMFQNTISKSDGTALSHPIFDTTHSVQWQSGPSATGPWTNMVGPGANSQILPLGPLQVLGTMYYQAIYLSSATKQIVPAHNDTIQQVTAQKPDGTDTIIVPYHINHIPQDTVLLSAGGCPLTSNVIAIGTFVGPNAKAGTDTSVCSTAAVKQMGTTATAGWVYSWTPTIGLSSSTTANPTAALNIPGSRQYIVTVANPACPVTAQDTAVITVNPIPTATISGATTVCLNTASPNITFTGANGTPPYTFTYKVNGGANQTIKTSAASSTTVIPISTATAATYTYTLVSIIESSSTACTQAQTGTVVVTVLPAPTASISGTTSICNGGTPPTIVFTGANGTPPYTFTYNINGGASQTVSTTGANSTVSITAPTGTSGVSTYSLTGVKDANASVCGAATGGITITVNPLPTASIAGTTVLCKGAPSPNVTFTGAVGTPPYTFTYNLNGGANQTITTSGVSTSVNISVSTNTPGTFAYNLVSVKDGSSTACTQAQTGTATVVINPLPTATIAGTTNKCLNDPNPSIIFTGAGSTPPYTFTYTLNGGANQTVTSDGTGVATVSAPTSAGGTFTYSLVSVQDASSVTCSQAQTGSAVVTVNPMGALLAGTTIVCQNAALPTVSFTGSGGAAPYTFTYNINGGANLTATSNGAGVVTVTAPTGITGDFAYTLSSMKDNNALTCASVASVTVAVSLLPTASVSGTATRCINGPSPDITFTGATTAAPYTFTYNINGGGNQTVTSDGTGMAIIPAPTNTAGTYTYNLVSVQDGTAQTCAQTQTGGAVVTVNPLEANVTGTTTLCENAASPNLTFTGSGGTAPFTFTYNINGGGNQTITTTAGNSIALAVPTNASGTYTYSVINIQDATALTCVSLSDATVIVNPLPTAIIAGTTSMCENGAEPLITFTGATSTAPYTFTYTIDGGANQTVTTISGNSVTVSAPTNVTGTFTYNLLSVLDGSAQACSQAQAGSAIVTVTPLAATVAGAVAVCIDATSPTITFTGSGGTPPYTFNYTLNGVNNSVNGVFGDSAIVSASTSASGTFDYSLVSVQDGSATACSSTVAGATTVTINPLPTALIATSTPEICENSTGTILFTCSGGTPPYTITYSLNGSAPQTINTTGINTTVSITESGIPGTYTYTLLGVEDGIGCSQAQTGTAVIVIDPLPTATTSGTHAICQNSTYTLQNGEAGLTYGSPNWSITSGTGSIAAGINTLTPTYVAAAGDAGKTVTLTMTVTSTNSCNPQTATATYTIKVDSLPVAASGGKTAICQNATYTLANGEASASNGTIMWVENGTGNISSGATTLTPTYKAAAGDAGNTVTLTMTVTSNNTCNPQTSTAVYSIKVDSLPIAVAGGSKIICENGTAIVGGASSKNGSILWTTAGAGSISAGGTTLSPTYSAAAGDVGHPVTLTMTITSTNSCAPNTATAVYTINVDPLPVANSAGSQSICANSAATISGASALNGNVSWTDNGAGAITAGGNTTTPIYTAVLADGGKVVTMTMTVTSINSCAPATATATYPITVNPVPTAMIAGTTTVCQNDNPASVITFSVTSAGTVAPYTFTYAVNNGSNQTVIANGNSVIVPQPTANPGGYTYSLISLQDSNSPACFNTQSGSAKITVNQLPTATIGQPAVRCENDSPPTITFTGLGGGNSPYTFIYSINGGSAQTVSSTNAGKGYVTAPTTASGTFVYKLISVSYDNGKVCPNPQQDSTAVRVNPLPTAIISGGGAVCSDSLSPVIKFKGAIGKPPYIFTFTVNNGKNTTIVSNSKDSVNLAVPTDQAGTFNYSLIMVTDSLGCHQSQSGNPVPVVVHQNPYPSFQVDPEVTTILQPTISITDATLAADSYIWEFGDGAMSPSKTPQSHTYADTGHYRIKLWVTTNFGCKDSTYETVIVRLPYSLYIPNTFSPNDDGVNDVFLAKGDGISKFTMMIFDRWGNMIFYSDDINKGWDGRANGGSNISVMDAYVYVIVGTDLLHHDQTYRGVVNLIK